MWMREEEEGEHEVSSWGMERSKTTVDTARVTHTRSLLRDKHWKQVLQDL